MFVTRRIPRQTSYCLSKIFRFQSVSFVRSVWLPPGNTSRPRLSLNRSPRGWLERFVRAGYTNAGWGCFELEVIMPVRQTYSPRRRAWVARMPSTMPFMLLGPFRGRIVMRTQCMHTTLFDGVMPRAVVLLKLNFSPVG
jgi:hypothetical protein